MTRRATDNTKALDAFLVAKFEIDAMLARLAALSADHFETSPDEIHWGHVGTLNHYRAKLREITDSATECRDQEKCIMKYSDPACCSQIAKSSIQQGKS